MAQNKSLNEDVEFIGGVVFTVLAILFLVHGQPVSGLITAVGAVLTLWHNLRRRML